ncbi:MAG TPA: DUF928 domain-containing protein [Candidatus Obscuribacterales bacterium]
MNNELFYLIKLAFLGTLALLGLLNYPLGGFAKPTPSSSDSSDSIKIRFQEQDSDGSGRGRPADREGIGSRGDCPPVDVQLTALVPSRNVGSFVEPYPSLWFYVPYKSSEVTSAEFSLQDEHNNDVYRTNFSLPQNPGIISLNLAKATPLEINKMYQWYVKIYCTQQGLSTPIFIRGWVQRITLKPELEKQLQTANTPRQRVLFYAQNGIWYSALTELAKLGLTYPQDANFNQDWANLLRDVGLEKLIQKPISGEINL